MKREGGRERVKRERGEGGKRDSEKYGIKHYKGRKGPPERKKKRGGRGGEGGKEREREEREREREREMKGGRQKGM